MPRISETTSNTELYNQAISAGIVGDDHPKFDCHLDGTFTLGSFDCNLYDNPNKRGGLVKYTIDGATYDVSDTPNQVRYVVVDYNAGSPIIRTLLFSELEDINESDIIPVFTLFNENNDVLHHLDWDTLGQGLGNKLHMRQVKTQRFLRENGLDVSVTEPARSVQISSGRIWIGGNRIDLSNADSSNGDVPVCLTNFQGGSGYTDGEFTGVTTTGGTGTGLTVDIVVSGGSMTSARINTAGSGYTSRDVVDINAAGGGTGAQATMIMDRWGFWHNTGDGLTIDTTDGGDGILTTGEIAINTAGSGYYVGDVIPITSGTGTGATVSIDTVSAGGVVTAVSIVNGGTGYGTEVGLTTYSGFTFHVHEDGTGVYDNTYYDGGAGTGLVEVSAGQYVVSWVYRDPDYPGHAGYVLADQAYNTLAEAQGSRPRIDLPPEFSVLGLLVGRIIQVKDGTTSATVESAFDDIQRTGFVQSHSSLTGLQGGQTDEYFHLTSAQHAHNSAGFPVCLDSYIESPANASVQNIHGALQSLVTGQPLDSTPTDITVNKGTGKVYIVVNAGSDFTGEITLTGDTVDRDTGAVTVADTEVITIDTLSTDTVGTDSNGNAIWDIVDGYLTDKWFTGSVVLSTTDLTLTDVDVYHVSYEQFNDEPNVIIDTLDLNVQEGATNVRLSGHLYAMERTTGKKSDIINIGLVEKDADATATNLYFRLRHGSINKSINCITDGVWVQLYLPGTSAHSSLSMKVWARILPEV